MTTVAIIDAQEAVREGLSAVLPGSGLTVVGTCSDPFDADELLAVKRPEVAIVALYVADGRGLVLAGRLAQRFPAVAVLLYADSADAHVLGEALGIGAAGLALKAGPISGLVEGVRMVATGDRYVDPDVDVWHQPASAMKPHAALSPRERQVLGHMAGGLTGSQVAAELGLSVETIRTHVRNAVRKAGARSRVHAIVLGLQRGELEWPADPEPPPG